MLNGFIPRYDLEARIQHSKIDSWGYNMPSARMNRVEEVGTADFSSVMSGLVENLNTTMEAPDNLLKDAMMGNQNVDVHDVMTAVAKSEMGVTLATQVTGKILSAYERVMQIQI